MLLSCMCLTGVGHSLKTVLVIELNYNPGKFLRQTKWMLMWVSFSSFFEVLKKFALGIWFSAVLYHLPNFNSLRATIVWELPTMNWKKSLRGYLISSLATVPFSSCLHCSKIHQTFYLLLKMWPWSTKPVLSFFFFFCFFFFLFCTSCCFLHILLFFFAHLFCTSYCLLHILLFFAHLIVLHFFISLHILLLFLLFLPYVCPCVMLLYIICILIILHCPLSGPDSITFHF